MHEQFEHRGVQTALGRRRNISKAKLKILNLVTVN